MAPVALKVAVAPRQTPDEDPKTLTIGFGLTITLIVFVFTHPLALTPVTVYVVEVVGETVAFVPAILPGIHV